MNRTARSCSSWTDTAVRRTLGAMVEALEYAARLAASGDEGWRPTPGTAGGRSRRSSSTC
ncbi:MAG TPA: hypothetical protein VD866_01820 [Urbifossiella sp.]|nr:hypothetical protein [Urbifossiella sp.]